MDLIGKYREDQRKDQRKNFFQSIIFYILAVFFVVGIVLGSKFYEQEKDVTLMIRNIENVKTGDQIVLEFGRDMLQRSVDEGMIIEPKLQVKKQWVDQRTLGITPLEPPLPDTKYIILIDGAKTRFFVPQKVYQKGFSAAFFPKFRNVYPRDKQDQVETSEQIVINLENPLIEPFSLDVEINPMTGFEHKLNEVGTQLTITPTTAMLKKTEYSVKVFLNHKQLKEVTRELYSGTFTTKPPPPVIYSFATSKSTYRTEERKEDVSPQLLEGRYVDIDISSQTMFLFENGIEKGAFKVSSGKRGMDTPTGVFKVMGKSRRPWSKDYGLFMPWFIQFTRQGHGIHELPEWPSGYKEGTNHLGIPVSHGCVRLGIGAAKIVYDFTEIGTPLVIHY